ncbi:6,7-dimethyl-8-ribityllumazine synthase [Nitrospira sp. Kam-Ns4a]
MNTREGHQDAAGLRFGLVVSKFNEFVTERLLAAAVETLTKAGACEDDLEVVRVPGAFEIPLVARRLARSGRFDAVLCLGAVIRGETPHFEYISAEASRGIAQAALDADLPVVFGVLTTETVEQALARAGTLDRNKGAEAARTAIEMANLMRQWPGSSDKPAADNAARGRLTRRRPRASRRKSP